MGASIVECDLTFTTDGAQMCRDAECDPAGEEARKDSDMRVARLGSRSACAASSPVARNRD
jgi:hypothetical protein